MRGDLKTWWGKLTDDDFEQDRRAKGQADRADTRKIRVYSRAGSSKRLRGAFKSIVTRPAVALPTMSAKAREFGATATQKANQAAPVIGEKMKSLANVIREKAPREGSVGTTATKVAAGLESASDYLQEKKFDHLGEDFRGLVRRYPLRSLLIGLGLGFLLAGRNRKMRSMEHL